MIEMQMESKHAIVKLVRHLKKWTNHDSSCGCCFHHFFSFTDNENAERAFSVNKSQHLKMHFAFEIGKVQKSTFDWLTLGWTIWFRLGNPMHVDTLHARTVIR